MTYTLEVGLDSNNFYVTFICCVICVSGTRVSYCIKAIGFVSIFVNVRRNAHPRPYGRLSLRHLFYVRPKER